MARRANVAPPPYPKKPHHGQARIKMFGEHRYLGAFGSDKSREAHRQAVVEWAARVASDTTQKPAKASPSLTIRQLVGKWLEHVKTHYMRDGKLTKEGKAHVQAAKPLVRTYGNALVAEFTAADLVALRSVILSGSWINPEEQAARRSVNGRCGHLKQTRRTANRNLTRLKTMFRWAEVKELIPEGRYQRLLAVPGLTVGELGAEDPDDVPPADEDLLAATLPGLAPHIRVMVDTLLLTGARIGELVSLRVKDIERAPRIEVTRGVFFQTNGCWVYRPAKWKGSHHGLKRLLLFGPKVQTILKPILSADPEAFVFASPRTVGAYAQAIHHACDRVFPAPDKLRRQLLPRNGRPGRRARESNLQRLARLTIAERKQLEQWQLAHRWHPHQLRHNAAKRLRDQFGWEVARTILGHRAIEMTAHYAGDSLEAAAAAMAKAG